tara:strand:+ start:1806 stop:2063 length:258 start_codon:yes stop_codon:yes gene_type:complete
MYTRKQLWRRVQRKTQDIKNINIEPKKKEKKVNFYNIVYVTLIPSIKEINNQNLKHSIWWDDLDYLMFRREYMKEIENNKKYQSL